jgi:general secretion pathway protein E
LIRLGAPRPAEIAISTIPTAFHRERITLRFAGPRMPVRQPAELGFSRDVSAFFERVARARDGLFVISGPAVSGRTSTLYSLTAALASSGRSVLAVEEGPLFPLTGVTQVRPNSPASFPMSMAARHALRHDADVIVVDPLGDADALSCLQKAVLRRHLVLVSMHAPTPLDALRRLRGMSDDGYALAYGLRSILGQRLVRALCPSCRRPDPASRETAARYGLATGSLFQPGGCRGCGGIGFRGHLPAGWVLEITEDFRRSIERAGPEEDFRLSAPSGSKDPVRQAILGLAAAGATSLSEALLAAEA